LGIISYLFTLKCELAKKIRRINIDSKLINMAITLLQTLAQYKSIHLKWSRQVIDAISTVSAFNFNIQLVRDSNLFFFMFDVYGNY
jgi:hypothetical protein